MWGTITSLIVSMLIGGFIGWITNLIAVKALFHPHKSYHILGLEYQGLLPKRKKDLADNLGNMVGKELVNIPDIIDKVKPEDINPFIDKMVDDHEEGIQAAIHDYIANYLDELSNKINITIDGWPIPGFLKKKFDLRSLFSINTLVTKTTDSVVKLLKEKGKQAVPTVLTKAGNEIKNHIVVHDIVEQKVNAMDLDQLEAMVNRIANREMKMIEYLGGVLGIIVGALQWVIQHLLLS